jgi:hypothetical protein
MTLAARLAALGRWAPPAVTGYQITRVAPDGAVFAAVVLVIGQTEHGRARTISDDGAEPEHGSLMAQWFSLEAEP